MQGVISQSIKSLESIIVSTGQNVRDIIVSAINALKEVLLKLIGGTDNDKLLAAIRAVGGQVDETANKTRYFLHERLKEEGGSIRSHVTDIAAGLETLIKRIKLDVDYNRLLKPFAALEKLIKSLKFDVDYDRLLKPFPTLEKLIKGLKLNVDYDRLLKPFSSLEKLIKGIRLNVDYDRLLKPFSNLEKLIKGIKLNVNYDKIKKIVADALKTLKLPAVDYSKIKTIILDALKNLKDVVAVDYNQIKTILQEALKNLKITIPFSNSTDYNRIKTIIDNALKSFKVSAPVESKEILQRIRKLSDIIGVNEFPASLPETLINEDQGWLGNLIPDKNINISNYAQLFKWYIERFDEICGQFEIPIEIKDADPATPGDQPVGIKIPNIAEGIAEILGLLLQATINSETLINMNTRNLLTSGQDYQQNYKSYMLLQTIIDYLGYKTKNTIEKIPLQFDPSKDTMEELLKEIEQEVVVEEYDEETNFRSTVLRLEHAAAITQAVHLRRVDTEGDVTSKIMNIIKGYNLLNDKLNNEEKDENGKTDFDRFLEDVQVGFINYTGVADSANPYGRPYQNRPKIKKIGDNQVDGTP